MWSFRWKRYRLEKEREVDEITDRGEAVDRYITFCNTVVDSDEEKSGFAGRRRKGVVVYSIIRPIFFPHF